MSAQAERDAKYRRKDPEARKRQMREAHKRWRSRQDRNLLSKFERLRKQAAEQAAEEGVDRRVVYARWELDRPYSEWVKTYEARTA